MKNNCKGKAENKILDPRTKICLMFCVSTLALVCDSLQFLLPILLVSFLLALLISGFKHLRQSLKKIRGLLPLLLMITLVQSAMNPAGRTIFSIDHLRLLTTGGIALGMQFFCRILAILLMGILLASEEPRRTIQGLIQCKMPYELAFMTVIAIRFLPQFREDFMCSLNALQLRGIDLSKTPLKKRFAVYTYLLWPTMSTMLVKADELSLAMEMRAFRSHQTRTSYVSLVLSWKDYLTMVIAVGLTCTILYSWFK